MSRVLPKVGGLAAQLGGGSFTTGATGAASAEISRNLVKDLSPDAQQWASVIIGGAAAKVVGGNAQVGASTALSGTVNNDLAHKITGITKGILNGVEEDAKGLIDFIVNYQETIENLKDTANAIYDLGKEQGFGAVFAEIGNAIGGDWVNKYDTIENEYINGMIDENTYDYRIGMLAGEVTYFIASTVAEPEKLAVNPKLLTKVAKLSKVEKLSEFTLEPVIVTAKRIEGSSKATLNYITTSGVKLEATPGKTTTVLGTFKADTKNILDELGNVKSTDFGPRDGGFNLLNTPDELYKTSEQFWNQYNKPWLDNVVERKDVIILATKPTADALYRINIDTGVKELSGFGKEYNYLLDHGYKFDSSTMQMVPKN